MLISTFLVLMGIAVAGVADAEPAKQKAAVAVLSERPLKVAGQGFARGERVVVRATVATDTRAKTVVATRTGAFTVSFPELSAECRPYSVSATGRSGSRASAFPKIRIAEPCGMSPQE